MGQVSRLLGAVATGLALWSAPAHAALTLFNTEATFVAATGAGDLTGGGFTAVGTLNNVDFGDLNFQRAGAAVNLTFAEFNTELPGIDLAVGGVEDFRVTHIPGTGLHSMGFTVREIDFGGGVGADEPSLFNVSLLNGASVVDQFQFVPLLAQNIFVGFFSETAFTSVFIDEIVGGARDERFAVFLAGSQDFLNAVPSPGALMLLGMGLTGLLLGRRLKMPSEGAPA